MKKHTVITALILGLIFVGSQAFAQTVNYKISVTVPAIVGFNVPADDAADEPIELAQLNLNNWDVTKEEVLRNDERVILQTITVK